MRPPSDMPERPTRIPRAPGSARGRTLLIVAAVALFLLITSLRGIAGFYTDYLWFESLGYDGVFTGVLGAKVSLAAIFVAVFFAVCWLNLYIADRLAPSFPPPGPEQEVFDRFRDAIGHRTGLFRIGIAGLLALVAGTGMSQEWRSWLLFVNGGDWGRSDAQFGTDIGFYVFRLPFLSSVADWAFASVLIVLVVTIAAHFANGGIRVQPAGPGAIGPRVTAQVKAHISVLLGLLALIRAGGYLLERYELTTSTRGVVDGASFTDVNAQLPALNLLVMISVASFALFIVNIWRRGWVLPMLGVGLWGLVALVAGGIYPEVIQRFQVQPNESSKEALYIERNIAATREALGLESVDTQQYELNTDVENVDLTDNRPTVANIRLWDPSRTVLEQTFSRLEQLLPYYELNDVDVDRYEIDGELTQVVLSARDLDVGGIPASSWEAEHVIYTHGYGIVMASGTSKTEQGRPDFILQQVPVKENTSLELDQPQIYFGEDLDGYSITNATRDELDYQVGEDTVFTRYEGEDGVGIGSLLRRVAFSLRFGQYDPLITNFIDGDSRIHYVKDVKDRVEMLAPFLEFDADPYPVVTGDGVKWFVDGYTTTGRYPYAQRADNRQLTAGSGLDGRFNYVRNSVKAVVDAYDGTVDFYVVDPDDPIIQAWRSAFPELFTDFSELPEDLVDHVRYPEDLFRVQTNMWARYHVDNALTFYSENDFWNVAADPGTSGAGAAGPPPTNAAGEPIGPSQSTRIDPYYLLTELPGEDGVEFVILRSYVPVGADDQNQQLTAFMVARSDPEHYGELVTYEMPRDRRPDGPAIVADAMQSDPSVSEQQTLLGQGGSTVKFGNLILVPVDDSLLYVRPFYVESSQVEIPELKKVIAFFESRVAVADTLEEALAELFGDVPDLEEVVDDDGEPADDPDPAAPDDPSDSDDGTVDERAARLLEEAIALHDEAQAALDDNDLGEYQEKTAEAEDKTAEALELLGGTTTTTTIPPDTTTTVPETEEA